MFLSNFSSEMGKYINYERLCILLARADTKVQFIEQDYETAFWINDREQRELIIVDMSEEIYSNPEYDGDKCYVCEVFFNGYNKTISFKNDIDKFNELFDIEIMEIIDDQTINITPRLVNFLNKFQELESYIRIQNQPYKYPQKLYLHNFLEIDYENALVNFNSKDVPYHKIENTRDNVYGKISDYVEIQFSFIEKKIREITNLLTYPFIPVKDNVPTEHNKKYSPPKGVPSYSHIVLDQKYLEYLPAVFNKLIDLRYLKSDAKLKDFRKLFNEKRDNEHIGWLGSNGSLRYFLMTLQKRGIIKFPKSNKWKLISECFFNGNENSDFNLESLRGAKIPADTEQLDKIIKIFPPHK